MADSSAPPDLPELGEDEGRLMDFLSDTSFAAVADAVESAMALDLADLPEIDADVHLSSDAVFDPDGFEELSDGDLPTPHLRVANLPATADEEQLQEFFARFGNVQDLQFEDDQSCLVRFKTFEDTDRFLRSELEFEEMELE